MSALPYVTAPGNVDKALIGIQSAATPTSVSQDFVKTILKIKGGSGDQMTAYLKKIGFVNADKSPSDIYKAYRNPASRGKAAAHALKIGYAALYLRNEYVQNLPDAELRGLIIEETGAEQDSAVVTLVASCIKSIKKYATWTPELDETLVEEPKGKAILKFDEAATQHHQSEPRHGVGLNLGYTINLNLPATSDISVFNSIFKSLKEHLLKSYDD